MTSISKIIALVATLMTIATTYQTLTKAQQEINEYYIIRAYEILLKERCGK